MNELIVNPADPGTIPKFVDPVPFPEVLRPIGKEGAKPLFEIAMRQVQQQLHRDFPPTTVWGYNGTYPGPTIEARRNRAIVVRYLNDLPTTHLLPVDHSVHGAEPFRPEVRTVVHLHDGNLPAVFDGHPDAWFTPGITEARPALHDQRLHLSQPAAGDHSVVPRPCHRHHQAERLCRAGRILPAPRQVRRRAEAAPRAVSRCRSSSRTGPSTRTLRSSIRRASRRSSSGTPSSSTARSGRSWTWSPAGTGSGS